MAKTHTKDPIIGGSTVLGLIFDNGVIIAADSLSSFGSMARFKNLTRIHKVNKLTMIGAGGDMADFQHVWKSIEQKQIEDESLMDGKCSGPLALHTWLTRLNYNRRNKFDPYWVEWVVAGVQNDQPFLGYVDKLGTSYQNKTIASGRLGQLASPMFDELTSGIAPEKLTEQQARDIIEQVMRLLFYRDAYALQRYHIGVITKDKEARVEGPFELKTDWSAGISKIN